jgi:hypothetical protein
VLSQAVVALVPPIYEVITHKEAVERKEAWRVKPWLSELDVPEWQELAGDRLGWRKVLKSIKIRTYLVLQVQDRRWIERKR